MEKLFPEIASLEHVMRLARGGAIAGILFAGLVLLDGMLGKSTLFRPSLQSAAMGFEISLILFLTWRVWTGRGFVSAILLMALLVLATMTGIRSGAFGPAWTIAYFGLGLMILNAIRACLRHDTFIAAPTRAN